MSCQYTVIQNCCQSRDKLPFCAWLPTNRIDCSRLKCLIFSSVSLSVSVNFQLLSTFFVWSIQEYRKEKKLYRENG